MPCPRTGKMPQIHETAFIAPTAVIIGDVIIGERSNVWFGAVLRGDFGSIEIGKNTSIQENTTIHMEAGTYVKVGDNCIIGHHAMIHGPCTIGNGCLIGIGSKILHRSILGDGVTVGAGAVVLGKEFPSRCLVVGIPADLKKILPQRGKMEGEKTSEMYAENGKLYKDFFSKNLEFL